MGKDGQPSWPAAANCFFSTLQPPPVTVKTAVGAGDAVVVAGAVWALLQSLYLHATVGLWGVTTGTRPTAMHDDLQPQNHGRNSTPSCARSPYESFHRTIFSRSTIRAIVTPFRNHSSA